MVRNLYNAVILFSRPDISFREKCVICFDYCKITLQHRLFPSRNKFVFLGRTITSLSFANSQHIIREVFMFGDYACKLDSTNPVIIDCGGNIGMTTLFYKRAFPAARITVFEPTARTFEALSANVAGLADVEAVNAAVGGENGAVSFWELPGNPGGSTSSPDVFKIKSRNNDFVETKVRSVKLSEYIRDTVDILKLDIEGGEGIVVQDLVDSGKIHDVKNIILEYHYNRINFSNRLSSIVNNLETSGFKLYFFGSDYGISSDRIRIDSYHFMIRASRE